MSSEAHRGAEAPGPFQVRGDARVQGITDLLLEQQVRTRGATRLFGDPQRALQSQNYQLSSQLPITTGMIVHALPHINCYKVQMSYGGGWIICRLGTEAACIPIGVRRGSPLPAGSRVLVWKDHGDTVGTILCALPHQLEDSRVAVPGYLLQGSGVGIKREQAHTQPLTMFGAGGMRDFSCQSPVDATSMEWSRVAETGVAIMISPAEAVLKVNELCGLFLSLYDSHMLVTGFQFDFSTAAKECRYRHDEGEHRVDEHVPIYPWEGIGVYTPGGADMAANFADKDVQYTLHKGSVDLPDGAENTQPFYRVQHYSGYPGQGGLKFVTVPPKITGVRRQVDTDKDIGVFAEHVGLDGSYVLQSAKSIIIAKRCKLTIPKEVKLPEDASGDDATANNYKFSGQFGSGAVHQVNDLTVPVGAPRSVLSVAGVQDILAWNINWKRLHPFHYHSHDYKTWQAGEDSATFPRISEPLAFNALTASGYLAEPAPVTLHIDHRYNSVSYFLRESFLAFNDDGTVVLAGGAGEELVFGNGKIRLATAGTIELLAGCEVVTIANEIVLKAHGSIDISSSQRDVRVRALHNLHMLGEDNVLIESKSPNGLQNYQNNIGEDVSAGGIVLKSQSVVSLLGDEIYALSGAGHTGSGDVVFDAARMTNDVIFNARAVRTFCLDGMEIWTFDNPTGTAQHSHFFGALCAHHHTDLVVTGDTVIGACEKSVLVVQGSINATANVAAGGRLADSKGGTLAKVAGGFASAVLGQAQLQCQRVVAFTVDGTAAHTYVFAEHWYTAQHCGNHDLVTLYLGFSYRDSDVVGAQYHTQNLVFVEPRWTQIVRCGGGSGGVAWAETPVTYQGRQLYPWPGRVQTITNTTFVRLTTTTMFDWTSGYDKDRPGPYENPTLSAPSFVTMQTGFKIIAQA